MPTIRITGVQMSVSSNLEENLPRILEHIVSCKGDYIVFPEMSLTGYHGDFDDRAARRAWNQIATACRQSYTTAIIGTGAKEADGTYIQARIYSHEGQLLGTHEKLVPTNGDRSFCRPGEELRVFRHHGLAFGCLICNDLWVTPGCGPYPDPRLTYQLGQRGAQVIFHLVSSGVSDIHIPYHESNLMLRAMESNLHICTVNAAKTPGVSCASGIMSPEGKWLVQCPRKGEHTYTYELELEFEDEEE